MMTIEEIEILLDSLTQKWHQLGYIECLSKSVPVTQEEIEQLKGWIEEEKIQLLDGIEKFSRSWFEGGFNAGLRENNKEQ